MQYISSLSQVFYRAFLAMVFLVSSSSVWASELLELELREERKVVDHLLVRAEVRESESGAWVTYTAAHEVKDDEPRKKLTLDLDFGAITILKNDVGIPNPGGTRFELKAPNALPSFRTYLTWAISEKHSIRVLYAPFSTTQTFTPSSDLAFNGLQYLAGQSVDAFYKFNSYRLGYIYHFDRTGDLMFRIGFTNKIRDARIGLKQNGRDNGFDDLGYVPLIHLGARYQFLKDRAFADLEVEGLAVPGAPGRAVEPSLLLGWKVSRSLSVSAGYRFLEGGADVNIYNFAFIQTVFGRVSVSF